MSQFVAKLTVFFLPFLAIFAVPIAILAGGGELTTVDSVVARQTRPAELLYGQAYSNPVKRFKLRSIQRRRPEVLVLGSSRVMQFRADFFVSPNQFYNGGGTVATIWDFRHVLDRLSGTNGPRTVVLGLDQWFFNPNWSERRDLGPREFDVEDTPLNIIQRNWRAVYLGVASGKIDVWRLLDGAPVVGLNAMMRENGFRNDGSYYYGDVIEAPDRADYWDRGFKDSFQRIEQGDRRFEWADIIDSSSVAEVDHLLGDAMAKGIHVIGILPPFAPGVTARMMATARYSYLNQLLPALRPLFAGRGFEILDFTDATNLGATDSEFIDGFHGSDKTYLRILLRLASATPSLAAIIDRGALERRLQQATRYEAPDLR